MRRRGAAGRNASAEDINNLCSIKQFCVEKSKEQNGKQRQRRGERQTNEHGKVGSWSLRDVYLKPEQLLVYTNRILPHSSYTPTSIPTRKKKEKTKGGEGVGASRGGVYLNVYLKGKCYCSNHDWHRTPPSPSFPLFTFPPPQRHPVFLCRSDPRAHLTHTSVRALGMTVPCQR